MIEVKVGNVWREMTQEQARRMAEFYLGEYDKDAVEALFHGVTLFELMKEESQ